METAKPKTLGDFPQLVISDVRPGATSDDGYQSFEIGASFDPILERRFDEMTEASEYSGFGFCSVSVSASLLC